MRRGMVGPGGNVVVVVDVVVVEVVDVVDVVVVVDVLDGLSGDAGDVVVVLASGRRRIRWRRRHGQHRQDCQADERTGADHAADHARGGAAKSTACLPCAPRYARLRTVLPL